MEVSDAYHQGYGCGYNGGLADNPYPENTKEYQEWDDGYADGVMNS